MNIEEVDAVRGHAFLPSDTELRSYPALYATDGVKLSEKIVYQHWFLGSCDWWLFEVDADERLAFGYVCLGDTRNAEMGYFNLDEVGTVRARHPQLGYAFPVERDLDWTPVPFSEVEHHCR